MAEYFDSADATFKPIPPAECYVISTDTFMSGWGRAEGKINKVVVACPDRDTAERVKRYAQERGDQRGVIIRAKVPAAPAHVLYSLQQGWIRTSRIPGWPYKDEDEFLRQIQAS